jgi:hypothetical protein
MIDTVLQGLLPMFSARGVLMPDGWGKFDIDTFRATPQDGNEDHVESTLGSQYQCNLSATHPAPNLHQLVVRARLGKQSSVETRENQTDCLQM